MKSLVWLACIVLLTSFCLAEDYNYGLTCSALSSGFCPSASFRLLKVINTTVTNLNVTGNIDNRPYNITTNTLKSGDVIANSITVDNNAKVGSLLVNTLSHGAYFAEFGGDAKFNDNLYVGQSGGANYFTVDNFGGVKADTYSSNPSDALRLTADTLAYMTSLGGFYLYGASYGDIQGHLDIGNGWFQADGGTSTLQLDGGTLNVINGGTAHFDGDVTWGGGISTLNLNGGITTALGSPISFDGGTIFSDGAGNWRIDGTGDFSGNSLGVLNGRIYAGQGIESHSNPDGKGLDVQTGYTSLDGGRIVTDAGGNMRLGSVGIIGGNSILSILTTENTAGDFTVVLITLSNLKLAEGQKPELKAEQVRP